MNDHPANIPLVKKLSEIVTNLSLANPISGDGGGDNYCSLCYAESLNAEVKHTPDCPWQMARDYEDDRRTSGN